MEISNILWSRKIFFCKELLSSLRLIFGWKKIIENSEALEIENIEALEIHALYYGFRGTLKLRESI